VSPSLFGNEYYTHRLIGTMINAADELPEQAMKSDRFKQVITGEPVAARQIYREAGEVRCLALHFYTCNELPLFSGGIDAGILRRLLLIQFNRTIPVEERVEDLGKRIAAEEADLLLVFAAEGLRRVLKQRGYTQPPSSARVMTEYLEEADPVRGWCAQRLLIDPAQSWKLSSAEAYADFTAWCRDQGIKESYIVGNRSFGKRLLRTDPRIQRLRSDGSYYAGVKLKPL
jgi:phage/plasmid-associated DNA primase